MGHHTASGIVTTQEAPTVSSALRAVVANWNDTERNRDEDARDGASPRYPMMTSEAAALALNGTSLPVRDGQSVVVPLCSNADAVTKVTKRKLTISGEQLSALRAAPTQIYALEDRVLKEFGDTVIGLELVSMPKPRKARATGTAGKAATWYHLIDQNGRTVGDRHSSQADARSAAVALIDSDPRYSRLAVRAIITRDTGDQNLVVIERTEPDTAEVTLNITTSTPKVGAAQVAWLVGFDYHS